MKICFLTLLSGSGGFGLAVNGGLHVVSGCES